MSGHYRNTLPTALGAIRESLENDTATEYQLVQHSAAIAANGRGLYRLWHTISGDGIVDACERARFGAELAAHVQADTAHTEGDLLSLNNNRAINRRMCDLYATEPSTNLLPPTPLTVGEVLA